MNRDILIFGAGKIGRGFLGHLFFRSGYKLTFVDPQQELVGHLDAGGSYPVFVFGTDKKSETISGVRAIPLSDEAATLDAIGRHNLFATAVGGQNLERVGALLARGLQARFDADRRGDVNVIICENYKNPADILRRTILANSHDPAFRKWIEGHLGLVETQVLRSCVEPRAEIKRQHPLAVEVQDWWILPCDADAFRGAVPVCDGLSPRPHFQNELIRKIYTYNCSNAVISYLGYLRGYVMLSDAANDTDILEVVRGVYEESGHGLIAEYQFDPKEQEKLQKLALAKYKDRSILDPIERNARDSQRKLSSTDRLVGPANLVIKHGGTPNNLALAIAAGLHYNGSDDAGTQHVQHILRTQGLKKAIREICQLPADSDLGRLIRAGARDLSRFNNIGHKLILE